ncbi:adenine nucleotide translocase lysine N-methyltransferase isoform X1 [Paroedura picta]|uniref:adenine nucleotide translocase lysine N-methyltransferase isoform X1 n=1 Tax=Paroedura picta TaxID=143630 RepID=UPI004056BE01
MDPEDAEQLASEMRGKTIDGWALLQFATGTGLAAYVVWAGVLMPGFRKVPLKLQVPYVPASVKQVENVMSLLAGRSGKMVDLGSGDGRILGQMQMLEPCLHPWCPRRRILAVHAREGCKRNRKEGESVRRSVCMSKGTAREGSCQVLEAHRRGFRPAIGYELNPWLLRLSSYRAWKAGCYGEVSYRREDLWKVDLSDCGNVTVFLAPSVLPLLERKLLAELPEEARVVAGRFPLPNWASTSTAGDGLNQAWAYDLKAVRAARRDNPEGSSV